ncbi:MAG: hypothetical protein ACTSQE_08350, partial [Candidatus Heimdallarchaeaceae archaeon]
MIPGTLRPLPKKLAKTKQEAERLIRAIEYDSETTKEMLSSSQNYTFEEVRSQYLRYLDYYTKIKPLAKDADKLLVKYSKDPLLRDIVYKLFDSLEKNERRVEQDVQRLDTVLMAKRKGYIEETIPSIKAEIKSKLSFLRNLDFEELLQDSESYSNIISAIVSKVEILRDEYSKLLQGTIDVDMYNHLEEKISEIEDELKEYILILATCKMEMLTNKSERILEKGIAIYEKFEFEQNSELIEESQKFLSESTPILKEMISLKIDIPKKAMKKSFEIKFNELRERFDKNKLALDELISKLQTRAQLLETNIDRINALRDYADSYSEGIKETAELLKIKRKGSFRLYLKENLIPHITLLESGIVKIPKSDELSANFIDEIIIKLEEIDSHNIVKDWFNGFCSTKVGKSIYETSKKI